MFNVKYFPSAVREFRGMPLVMLRLKGIPKLLHHSTLSVDIWGVISSHFTVRTNILEVVGKFKCGLPGGGHSGEMTRAIVLKGT